HRLFGGEPIRRPADGGQALREVRQGGEIPCGRSARRRLHLILLPLGALWQRRPADKLRLLVWRFRSPHHFWSKFVMRISEPKPHWINMLPVSFDSKFADGDAAQ